MPPGAVGLHEMIEGFERDQSAVAITDQRHRTFRIDLAEQPGQIVPFRHRPLIFLSRVAQQNPIFGTGPGDDDGAEWGGGGATGRRPRGQKQTLLQGGAVVVAIPVHKQEEGPGGVFHQAGQVGSLPTPVVSQFFDPHMRRGRHAANVGQAAGAHRPNIRRVAGCGQAGALRAWGRWDRHHQLIFRQGGCRQGTARRHQPGCQQQPRQSSAGQPSCEWLATAGGGFRDGRHRACSYCGALLKGCAERGVRCGSDSDKKL